MAEELKRDLGVDAALIEKSDGSFDVIADGKNIFSRHNTGRFPEPGEVPRLIKAVQ